MQTAPKTFLFVPVLAAESGGAARVAPHLNDFFFLAHWHEPGDGFPYVEEEEEEEGEEVGWGPDADTASTSSVVKRSPGGFNGGPGSEPLLSEGVRLQPHPVLDASAILTAMQDISHLASLSQAVALDVDVHRYQMNIISHLRIHRAVTAGASPAATKHFDRLIRCLAPLHGVDYATPALVALAARKVYLHRLEIAGPEAERSVQWGGDVRAVEALLEGVGPEEVIEDVLGMVAAPV